MGDIDNITIQDMQSNNDDEEIIIENIAIENIIPTNNSGVHQPLEKNKQ